MRHNKIDLCILAGGFLELLIGTLHIFWPLTLLQTIEFQALPVNIQKFMQLLCWAVGICLITFAFLSFYCSRHTSSYPNLVKVFCLTQTALWTIRLIFELILPVRIALYGIQKPYLFILPGVAIIISLYLTPVILLRKLKGQYTV